MEANSSDYEFDNDDEINIPNSHLLTSDDIHLGEFASSKTAASSNSSSSHRQAAAPAQAPTTPTHAGWKFPRTPTISTFDSPKTHDTSSGIDDLDGLSLTQFGIDDDDEEEDNNSSDEDNNGFSNSVADTHDVMEHPYNGNSVNLASSIPRRCNDVNNYDDDDDDDDYQSSFASSTSFSVNYKKRRIANIYDNASESATAAGSTSVNSSSSSGSPSGSINGSRSGSGSGSGSGDSVSSTGGSSSSGNETFSDMNYTTSEGESFFLSPEMAGFANPTPTQFSPQMVNGVNVNVIVNGNGNGCYGNGGNKFNGIHNVQNNTIHSVHNGSVGSHINFNEITYNNLQYDVRPNAGKKIGNISISSITSTSTPPSSSSTAAQPQLQRQTSPIITRKTFMHTKSPKLITTSSTITMAPPVINPKVTLSLTTSKNKHRTEKVKHNSFRLDKDILDVDGGSGGGGGDGKGVEEERERNDDEEEEESNCGESPNRYPVVTHDYDSSSVDMNIAIKDDEDLSIDCGNNINNDDDDEVDIVDDSDAFEEQRRRLFVPKRYKTKVVDTSSYSSPSLSPYVRGKDCKGKRAAAPSRRCRNNSEVSNDDNYSEVAYGGKRYNCDSSTTTTTTTNTNSNTNSSTDDENDDDDDDDGYNDDDDEEEDDDDDENIIIDYGEGTEDRDDIEGCHDQSYTFTDVEGVDDIINENFDEDDILNNDSNGAIINDNDMINREDLHIHESPSHYREHAYDDIIRRNFGITNSSSRSSSQSMSITPSSRRPFNYSQTSQQHQPSRSPQGSQPSLSPHHQHSHSQTNISISQRGIRAEDNGENDIVVTIPPRAPTISAIARNRGYYDDDDDDDYSYGDYDNDDGANSGGNDVFSQFMDAKYAMRKLIAAEYARSLIRTKAKGSTNASSPTTVVLARPCWKLIKESLELTLSKVPSNVEAFSCTSEIFRYNLVKVVSYILTQVSAESNVAAAESTDKDQPTRRQSTSCSRRSFESRSAARHTSTLETFIMRFREYTSAGPEIFLMALILIDRYTEKISVTSENVNQVWTAAFISVSKLYDDFHNK